MALERGLEFSRRDIPKLYRLRSAARGQQLAIAAESKRMHVELGVGTRALLEGGLLLACGHVPQFYRLVVTPRGQ